MTHVPHIPLPLSLPSQINFSSALHGWNGSEMGTAFPLFVNEAAYYEKGVALVLARKVDVQVQWWCRWRFERKKILCWRCMQLVFTQVEVHISKMQPETQ